MSESGTTFTKKVFSAILFTVVTLQLAIATKPFLYAFPPLHLHGTFPLVASLVSMWIGKWFGLLQFRPLDWRVARLIYPLILLYIGSTATSLETFGIISKDFNMLRCLVLLTTITFILERIILKVGMSTLIKSTVGAMVVGAMVLETEDNHISIMKYLLIFINYSICAAFRVYFKMILDSKELGVSGLMYYSTLIMLIPATTIAYVFGIWRDLAVSIYWGDLHLWSYFLLSFVMNVMTSYSTIMCLQYNGPLTTTIIGSTVNFLTAAVSYLESTQDNTGTFSWSYWTGWSTIVFASFLYLYVTFKPDSVPKNVLVSNGETCYDTSIVGKHESDCLV